MHEAPLAPGLPRAVRPPGDGAGAAAATRGDTHERTLGELAEDPDIDDAFEKFFRAEFLSAVTTLVTSGFARPAAEDAILSVMADAYEQWSAITYPRAWVLKAGYREALRRQRRDRDGLLRTARIAPREISDQCPPFDGQDQILRWLGQLPERQRQVVALHLDEFTYDEIAQILDIRPGTVRSTHRSARKALRRIIERERRDEAETGEDR
jgi:RNA polymerase sigma factor (sigma-70 family)